MHPIVNIAIRAARNAGNTIVRSLHHVDTISVTEKSQNDFVTEVDQRAEQDIIQTIRRAYPNHAILAEESGQQDGSEVEWIIDPLDGTTNFIHGFPHFAVSIGVRVKGRLEHGVIFDPLRNEIFSGSRGEGAQVNDRRMRIAKRNNLSGALLGTGFPFREDQDFDLYIQTLKVMMKDTAGIRRPGSAALDLAYVAAGRLDGFWEFGLRPWDSAAGALLILEAGGMVTDFTGGQDYLDSGNLVAGNLKIHQEMLDRLKTVLPAERARNSL